MKHTTNNIEFVSYSGEYPCLCYGELKVKIDGELFSFHYSYGKDEDHRNNKYESFWSSGGSVSFDENWQEEVTQGNWCLSVYDVSRYPKIIRDNLDNLLEVMNDNVIHGCCGGCV